MKKQKNGFYQSIRIAIAFILALALLPILHIESAGAAQLSITFNSPVETYDWKISWNSMSDANRYEYTVLDETDGDYIFYRDVTYGTSFTVPGRKIKTDHKYKVWVGALTADQPAGYMGIPSDHQAISYAIGYCKKDRKSTYFGVTYSQYNGTYHKKNEVYQVTCRQCGEFIEYVTESTKEEHTFVNGKCTKCSYEREIKPLTVSVNRNQKTAKVGEYIGAYASISGGSGSRIYGWAATCDGVTITETDLAEEEFGLTATKPGKWRFTLTVKDRSTGEIVSDTSGVITVSATECTHENKTMTLIDIKYIQKTENLHTVRSYYRITCSNPDCGEVINPSYYQDSTEEHSFNANGVCTKCGYTKVVQCNHASTRAEKIKADTYRQINSDSEHYRIEYYRDVCTNPDCNTIVIPEREVVIREPHTIVNGVCICGYIQPTPTCDHATTREIVNRRLEQYSETKHRLIVTYHIFCDCGQVNYTEDVDSLFDHQFDADGKCSCGYMKPKVCSVYGEAHQLSYTGYEEAHPHKVFKRCNCGYCEYTGTYKTANGTVQSESDCCICHGHKYDDAYQVNGAWYQKCINCGFTVSIKLSQEEQTVTIPKSSDPQVVSAFMSFVSVDNTINNDSFSTFHLTDESAKATIYDPLFNAAASVYEHSPEWTNPIKAGTHWLLDTIDGNDEELMIAICLVQDSLLQRVSQENKDLSTLSSLSTVMKNVNTVGDILDNSGSLETIFSLLVINDIIDATADDLTAISKFVSGSIELLGDAATMTEIFSQEAKALDQYSSEMITLAALLYDYYDNMEILEHLKSQYNSNSKIYEACSAIQEQMTNDMNNIFEVSIDVGVPLVKAVCDEAIEYGSKTLLPTYYTITKAASLAADGTELVTNTLFRTQSKIDATQLVYTYDTLLQGVHPNMSISSLDNEYFIYELNLYYTGMMLKFDALEDYLRADKTTEFMISDLKREREEFEKTYKEFIDSYYR